MEKITIKGFGPIQDAEIEVKKLLVLIGEQASGKSTIAKLIYFFKSLKDDFYSPALGLMERTDEFLLWGRPNEAAKAKFLHFFGRPKQQNDFEIIFQFDLGKTLVISQLKGEKLEAAFSQSMMDILASTEINALRKELADVEEDLAKDALDWTMFRSNDDIESKRKQMKSHSLRSQRMGLQIQIGNLANQAFGKSLTSLFIPTMREAAINYPPSLDKTEIASWSKKLSGLSIDDILMSEFITEVDRILGIFKKYGNFDSLFELDNLPFAPQQTEELNNRISAILKGKYDFSGDGEQFIHENGFVNLRDASSGQKSSIRIIQLIILAEIEKSKAFRVIEEPEAHLFPISQKALVELLVLLTNSQPENQVIITTHSPYVLSTLNNLLFATRVAEKNPAAEPEIAEIVPAAFRIDPQSFATYSLGNSLNPEAKYCENIVDAEMGMIDQNYLDDVSDLLGSEFDRLRMIHIRSFQRNGDF